MFFAKKTKPRSSSVAKLHEVLIFIRIKKIIVNQFWNKWTGLLLLFFLFNACAGSKNVNYKNPKSVSLAFCKALADNDYERAKQMGTAQTIEVISLLQNLNDLLSEEEKQRAKEAGAKQLKLLKKASCVLEQDSKEELASCQTCCDEEGAFNTAPITLKKENNQWLVHITKESLD